MSALSRSSLNTAHHSANCGEGAFVAATIAVVARVYAAGNIHKDIRVPMREIELAPTKSFNGRTEVNEPVRVYDASGPWGDPDFKGSVEEGLPSTSSTLTSSAASFASLAAPWTASVVLLI